MEAIRKEQLGEKLVWLLTVALFASFSIFDESSWVSIILLGITALIFLIDALQGHGKIRFALESYHKFVLLFCLFCYASSIWAWQPRLAIEKGTTVFEILVCTAVVYSHYSKRMEVSRLFEAVMWAGYIVVAYAISFYGIDTIRRVMVSGDRLVNGFTNINSIGMIGAIAVVITVHKILFVDHRVGWTSIFAIPTFVIIGISGSRKALVLVALGIVLLLLKRFGSKNIIKTILRWVIVGAVVYIAFRFLLTLPIFETVNSRMKGLTALITGVGNVDHSAWLRQRYMELGMEQFRKTPFLGIGMNNARLIVGAYFERETYLHNNYVELLADGGIVGFLCYYSIYIFLIYQLWGRRKSNDEYLVMCLTLIVMFLVMDYGGISYYSKSRYFYFLIFFLELKRLKEESEIKHYEQIS